VGIQKKTRLGQNSRRGESNGRWETNNIDSIVAQCCGYGSTLITTVAMEEQYNTNHSHLRFWASLFPDIGVSAVMRKEYKQL